MFIKQIDFISPRVTFYHQGYLAHSSIFSGILSIFSIVLILIIVVYFSLQIIQRNDPNSSYFISFINDAPTYQLNSTSLFHFINLAQISYETYNEGIDFTTFRIIGFERHYVNYLNTNKNLSIMSHWLYGYCDNETNTKGIKDLITYDFFGKTACIKKFYDSREHKYYDINDPKFRWPQIGHGLFNENNKIYNIIIERCQKETVEYVLGEGAQCRNDSKMIEFYRSARGLRLFHFYFLDNYINVLNYNNPINKFFYRLETPLSTDKFTVNDIHFNPTILKTHNGLLFDNVVEKISYAFHVKEASNEDKGNTDLFIVYSIFLRNVMNYYERSYKKIQDIFSNIGGMYQVVIIFATIINSFYNQYIILADTDILLNNSIYNEKVDFEEKRRKLKGSIKDLEKEKDKNQKDRKHSEKKHMRKVNSKEKSFNKIMENNNSTNNNITKAKINSVNEELNKKFNSDFIPKEKIKINKVNSKRNSTEKNFLYFFLYQVTCGKKFQAFNIYKHFRKKIISEEHLIRNHLNVYNLLRYTEKKRTRRNSYQLKDLMKLI